MASMFSADELRKRMATRDAERAAEELRLKAERDAAQTALVEEFHQPAARTSEQLMEMLRQVIGRAAERGESHAQVYQFPSLVCADQGRAINNSDPTWPETLAGRPLLAYEFWRDHLRPQGFGLRAEIIDYPGGMPGDVALILTW